MPSGKKFHHNYFQAADKTHISETTFLLYKKSHDCWKSQITSFIFRYDRFTLAFPHDSSVPDFPKITWGLLTNLVVLAIALQALFHMAVVAGMATFMAKYLQNQFSISASKANVFVGKFFWFLKCVALWLQAQRWLFLAKRGKTSFFTLFTYRCRIDRFYCRIQ